MHNKAIAKRQRNSSYGECIRSSAAAPHQTIEQCNYFTKTDPSDTPEQC